MSILCDMAAHAKVFKNGGSQAIRLPKDCRFPEDQAEVLVRRQGRRIILEPLDVWPDEFLASLGGWTAPIARPRQQKLAKLRDPFR
jgi:virulence-associated protein VagC